jgi:hypothetical protein
MLAKNGISARGLVNNTSKLLMIILMVVTAVIVAQLIDLPLEKIE